MSGPRETATRPMRTAIVTASYAPDLERCRLLCETIDAHVEGFTRHYILVEHADVPLFRSLETPTRVIVDERDLLPSWFRSFPDPLSLGRKRIWLSLRTKPLRGWHAQQFRRIAIAGHADEDALFYVDSDVVFLKRFSANRLWRGQDARLFRRDDALAGPGYGNQKMWSRNAGTALGIAEPVVSPHDYITTLIAWRRDATLGMCRRIEEKHGRHWLEVVGAERQFSECLLYGRYADEVLDGAGHFHDGHEFCRVRWFGPSLSDDEFREFIDSMAPEQVAIGMQSFIGTDIDRIRRMIGK